MSSNGSNEQPIPVEQSLVVADKGQGNNDDSVDQSGGRRKRSNPWLAHVKDTMKKNRGVSFKKILKLAKKSFKKAKSYRRKSQSQSQSYSGGKKRKLSKKGGSAIAGLDMEKLLGQQKGGNSVAGLDMEKLLGKQKGGSSIAGLDMEKLLGNQQQKGGSGVGGGKEGMQKFGESASSVV
jgi:hypothetical protein